MSADVKGRLKAELQASRLALPIKGRYCTYFITKTNPVGYKTAVSLTPNSIKITGGIFTVGAGKMSKFLPEVAANVSFIIAEYAPGKSFVPEKIIDSVKVTPGRVERSSIPIKRLETLYILDAKFE